MRTLLTVLFLILAVGGGFGIFDADDSTERRFDALAALVGIVGLAVLARGLRRKLGDEEYARVMGFSPTAITAIVRVTALTVALPVLVYWMITGHTAVDWDGGEGLLAMALGVAGLIAWGISTRYW
jgi:hypothetical protein